MRTIVLFVHYLVHYLQLFSVKILLAYDIVCFKQLVPGKRSMQIDFYRLS